MKRYFSTNIRMLDVGKVAYVHSPSELVIDTKSLLSLSTLHADTALALLTSLDSWLLLNKIGQPLCGQMTPNSAKMVSVLVHNSSAMFCLFRACF